MSARGLVSVIIPTFNRAESVLQAAASALGQTHAGVEVLIVDDGSTDDTAGRIESAWGNDPRVRYVAQENAGPAAARNRGMSLASGDYLAFLDSDDLWLPWKLEAQIAGLERFPEAGMIWSDLVAVRPDGTVVAGHDITRRYRAWEGHRREDLFSLSAAAAGILPGIAPLAGSRVWCGDVYRAMAAGNLVHTSTVLLTRERAEQVGGFDTTLEVSGEDYDFHLRTCRAGPVAFLDAATIRYQVDSADQLTRPELHVHIAGNFLRTVEKAASAGADPRVPPEDWERSLAHARDWYGRELLDSGRVTLGRRMLRQALSTRFTWGRLARWLVSLLPGPLRTVVHRISGRLRAPGHRS